MSIVLPTRPFPQKAVRWLVAFLGILTAFIVPVACRDWWVGEEPAAPVQMTSLFEAAAMGLWAVIFVVASVAGLRGARFAGMILLAATFPHRLAAAGDPVPRITFYT